MREGSRQKMRGDEGAKKEQGGRALYFSLLWAARLPGSAPCVTADVDSQRG